MNKIVTGIIIFIILIQLIPIDHENPQTKQNEEIVIPDDVRHIVEKSCYDCHSNKTVWPWYSEIAPVSWIVANHVKEGREELNFSEWKTYSEKRKNYKLKEILEKIEEDEMPLPSYLWLHKEANLTNSQKELLIKWAESLKIAIPDTTGL